MPCVDLCTLTDPILFRLPLVARELQEANGTEQAHWRQVVRVTPGEIARRSFSSDDVPWLGATDREGREHVLAAFRAECDPKRKHSRNYKFLCGPKAPRRRDDSVLPPT
jgi:hypothetical protein